MGLRTPADIERYELDLQKRVRNEQSCLVLYYYLNLSNTLLTRWFIFRHRQKPHLPQRHTII